MKLPTLGYIVSTAQTNVRRFPLVLLAGVVAAYAGLAMVEGEMGNPSNVRLIAAAALGLPLMFGLTVLAERRASTAAAHWGTMAAGISILAGLWWMWPRWTTDAQAAKYVQLAAAFHLFVAFAPFIGRNEPRAFWQYNRILFIRFLLAALYTFVLWAGLSGALLALDKLLGVAIANEAYARLWIILALVFNPWFFVSGVPQDLGALEEVDDYPTGLRVFTQYVLVPLVMLYLVILTLYLGKVVITREWPNGWIGNLVSGVAGGGILAWLLVHPLEQKTEHAWVKTFTRGFYVALMPAIVMLWFAIWKRVDQYGLTEKRYFLIVLSVWLAGIAVYYTFSRSRSIKLIPATLCAIALLTFVGPWGAYSISLGSQRARLEGLLVRHGLLVDGALRPATGTVSDSSVREISAGFRYLLEAHGESSVRPWISGDMERTIGVIGSGNAARADAGTRAIVGAMKLPYMDRWLTGGSDYFSYHSEERKDPVKIEGYSYAVRLSPGLTRDSITVGEGVRLHATSSPPALVVTRGGVRVLHVPFQSLLDSAALHRRRESVGSIPTPFLTIEVREGSAAALVALTHISGTIKGGTRTLTGLEGHIYLRVP